ncbi:hypothetical protein [Faecalibaculum rodentium]|uniref:hypothetical protein n=1 Tax=Faecalibaculum rodentium TaxID=1702221 RepID=UPI002730CEC0|nr:hypothetical protein [Faecalibaculum rodentium]
MKNVNDLYEAWVEYFEREEMEPDYFLPPELAILYTVLDWYNWIPKFDAPKCIVNLYKDIDENKDFSVQLSYNWTEQRYEIRFNENEGFPNMTIHATFDEAVRDLEMFRFDDFCDWIIEQMEPYLIPGPEKDDFEPEEWETAKQTMQDYGTKTINAVYSVFGKEEGKRALLDEDHLEGYCLFPAKSDEELGMYLATIHGVWDRIHKTLHDYFDVEQYGRDFRERSAGTYFWDGFIFHDSNFNEDNPWEA